MAATAAPARVTEEEPAPTGAPSGRRVRNDAATLALVLGIAALPGALTAVGGLVLGLAAVIAGFVGVARADRIEGAGQGRAVGGIIAGMFGMAFAFALPMLLGG